MNMGCDLITNGRCPYETDKGCTAICGGELPFGEALCNIEELEFKNPEVFEITKEGIEEFLLAFSNAIKKK